LAKQFGVPFYQTEAINSDRTVHIFQDLRADLGLSLGNGYIGRRVFSIPRHGMINVHGELLPRFQGAHSVIWPIHDGIEETGFTIHRIDDGIDTGDILYQERLPIAFRPTLRETVEASIERMRPRVPPALVRVCEDFDDFAAGARRQEGGRSYTTPTLRQFLRMARNHRRMYLEAARGAQSGGGDARERGGPG
jgi:methionyl-tRNA formyltransferase